jgi:hypothetical protein
MTTRKKSVIPIEPTRTTIASVRKEMQQPRMTESVRNDGIKHALTSAEELSAHSAKV